MAITETTPSEITAVKSQRARTNRENLSSAILEHSGDAPVRTLKGVGPQLERLLHKLGYSTISKLVFHLPIRHEDHTRITSINNANIGQSIIIEGTVTSCQLIHAARRYLKCTLADDSDEIQLIFFQTARYLKERLAPGNTIRCRGIFSVYRQHKRMLHPKLLPDDHPLDNTHLTPVYPLTAGLTQSKLRPLITQALALAEKHTWLNDFIPASWLAAHKLPTLSTALRYLHTPPPSTLEEASPARDALEKAQQRIGLEALMAHYIALQSLSDDQHASPSTPLPLSEQDLEGFLTNFPFHPTSGQQQCLSAFQKALVQNKPMCHLLQGDVGSGKTLLAAALAFAAVHNNHQAAVMAPTELLASQHAKQFQEWFEPLGFRVGLLSGRLSAAQKRAMQQAIARGDIDIAVGTHALIQPAVTFEKLAVCVIDEQHRFGVEQRLTLHEKGNNPHLLLMTATPIPRSLAMTLYGNLKALELKERPAQRKPIATRIMADGKRDELLAQIRNRCLAGEQVYWVCPLITPQDETDDECFAEDLTFGSTSMPIANAQEKPVDNSVSNSNDIANSDNDTDLKTTLENGPKDIGLAAETAYADFAEKLPDLSLGLVHGRMSDEEKAAVMARFRAGEHHMLIATTVIEVGIDVPNANIIVIESANRFGLSQLHQLRGRVGRGDKPAYCILLYQRPLNKKGKTRLQVLRDQDDGFRIAEHDLEQRGPGLWLGTAQSGSLPLPFASFDQAPHLITLAQTWSQQLLDADPNAASALRYRWQADPMRYARA